MSQELGNTGPDDQLEKKHFGEGGADKRYPCMRDEYKWSQGRPSVPDSRIPAKENTVIHGLEDDAKKFKAEAEKYQTAYHYQMAADYYNMAGDRRADLMNTHPNLKDQAHLDALDFCYDRARELAEKAEELGATDGSEWNPDYLFMSTPDNPEHPLLDDGDATVVMGDAAN